MTIFQLMATIAPWITVVLILGNLVICRKIWAIQSSRIDLLNEKIDNLWELFIDEGPKQPDPVEYTFNKIKRDKK